MTIVMFACLNLGGRWLAAQSEADPRQASILLDNGFVLHGHLIDEGRQVLIRLGPGSQVRMPRTRIRGVGDSLHDLFLIQHRQLHQGDTASQIELARWCLRNDLHEDTAYLLQELNRLAPRDPKIALLDQQLRQAMAPVKPAAAVSQTSQHTKPIAEAPQSSIEAVSTEQLVAFAQHVQPLLLNHCSATGCHGVLAKSEFKLLRPFHGQRLTQRMTARNLDSTLQFVDSVEPLQSRLLQAAKVPHANRQTPILDGPRNKQGLKLLEDWLSSLASGKSAPVNSEDVAVGESSLLQRLNSQNDQHASGNEVSEPDKLKPIRESVAGEAANHHAAVDPFDPDVFNRRYFPDRFRERNPFDQPLPPDSPSTTIEPASNASRNATLLDNNPGNSRTAAGESQR